MRISCITYIEKKKFEQASNAYFMYNVHRKKEI